MDVKGALGVWEGGGGGREEGWGGGRGVGGGGGEGGEGGGGVGLLSYTGVPCFYYELLQQLVSHRGWGRVQLYPSHPSPPQAAWPLMFDYLRSNLLPLPPSLSLPVRQGAGVEVVFTLYSPCHKATTSAVIIPLCSQGIP